MQRGNLIVYDGVGTILSQTGEAMGDILPHEYPEGVPYTELPYGAYYAEFQTSKLIGVNIETKEPIFEPFEIDVNQLSILKNQKITQSKQELENYLLNNPFQFVDGKFYNVTRDKQSLLTGALAIHQIKVAAGITSALKWNAVGEECSAWTIESLSGLAIGISNYVTPLVSKQQTYEVEINTCASIEELNSVIIDYAV